jgi:hypothetical protein
MIFKIIADDVEFTKEFLKKYNQKFDAKFELKEIHDWEVTFASIESNGANNDEILKWSIQFAKSSVRNKLGIYK